MYKKCLLLAGMLGVVSPLMHSQMIHITIPRHSELTPVQKLNRDGVDEVSKHKYEKAEALFFKAYLYDPADPFTLNNLGYVSELLGQVDRAADYYKLAMEQGCEATIDRSSDKKLKGQPMMDALGTIKNLPMRINRINTYAIQLLSQGRSFEAEAVLQQLLPLDPNNAFTLNNLGVAEEAVGNYEAALKYFDAAAATQSKQPVVVALKRSSRGKAISVVAYNSANDLRLKMATMTIAQIRAEMYAIRGLDALNKNDWDAARKDFQESYAQDPTNAFALNNLGYVAERDGQMEDAAAYYAQARRAQDADSEIGAASHPAAHGQHLADVALDSRRDVNLALNTQPATPVNTAEPLELLRRDGSVEPPVAAPAKPAEPAAPSDKPASAEPAAAPAGR